MNNKLPLISVLIAVKNESKFIEETLQALKDQDYPKELLEVIVIDGVSSDDTIKKAEEFKEDFINFKILKNPLELSASSWNMGIKEAGGEIISILSGHVLLERSYYSKVVKNITPNVAGVGGRAEPIGYNKTSELVSIAYRSKLGSGGATYIAGRKAEIVETISYGSYWKKDLLAVGGFDESVVRGQDWDLNLRLRKQGLSLMFYPNIKTRYYVRDSFTSLWKRQFLAGYWKWFINRKSARHVLFRHLVPGCFVLSLILLLVFAFISKLSLGLFLGLITFYLLAVLIESFSNKVKLADMLNMLIIFFIIHFAYGLGIILGIGKK